jgi:hypothetical protein
MRKRSQQPPGDERDCACSRLYSRCILAISVSVEKPSMTSASLVPILFLVRTRVDSLDRISSPDKLLVADGGIAHLNFCVQHIPCAVSKWVRPRVTLLDSDLLII